MNIFSLINQGIENEYFKLIEKYDINTVNQYGQSLLYEAIVFYQENIALDLISRKINLDIQDKIKGHAALHLVSMYPNIKIAEKILEYGGNVNLIDYYGNSPLWYAVFNSRGNYDFVKLFLKYKAKSEFKNKANRSPLDFAIQIEDNFLIKLLSECVQ